MDEISFVFGQMYNKLGKNIELLKAGSDESENLYFYEALYGNVRFVIQYNKQLGSYTLIMFDKNLIVRKVLIDVLTGILGFFPLLFREESLFDSENEITYFYDKWMGDYEYVLHLNDTATDIFQRQNKRGLNGNN